MASELKATHQCTICGARWRELDDFRWNLRSKECGPCCDNVPMGNQIEALEDVAPWSGPLTAEEQGLIDDAWQTHKAAATPPPADSADMIAPVGEVERVVEAMREDPFMDDLHLLGTTAQDMRMEHYATIALSAMSPAGEVEQRGYDRAIAEVVAWLREQDGYGEWYEVAEQIEAGEHKP